MKRFKNYTDAELETIANSFNKLTKQELRKDYECESKEGYTPFGDE